MAFVQFLVIPQRHDNKALEDSVLLGIFSQERS